MRSFLFNSSVCFIFGLFLVGCAHEKRNSHKQIRLSDLTPEEIQLINKEAFSKVTKKLEDLVEKAKTNEETKRFLSTDLFLKGNMSLMDGDYSTASILFKQLYKLAPEDEFVQKKFAISLIREGDLESAVSVLEKLYQNSADDRVGLILAGVYSGLEKENEAKKLYRHLLVKNPKNEDACIFLGKSLAVDKKTKEAIQQLRKCSSKDPKNGMYDYYIGKIQIDLGKVSQAINSFKRAHKRQPELGQAVSALGILLEERERHEEAIKIYKEYLHKNPRDNQILARLVQALFQKEQFEEVIPYAESLSDIEPDNLNLKVKLGILYTDAKRYPQAISIFKDLLAAAPSSDKILYYLGVIHQEMNRFHDSIEYFNQIPTSSALYTDSSVQMANMLSTLAITDETEIEKKGWRERFLSFVNQKITEFKDLRVEFSVIKAGFYEGIGEFKNAMESMMVVQDEKSFSIQHKYYLANLYEREKKYLESTALVMGIIENDPKNAHAWNFLGYSLLTRGEEMDKAYEYIKKAIDINPNDGYIRDSLGWYYFKKGQFSKALTELEFAYKKVPDDLEILKHLAIVHRQLKNFKRAKSYYQTALKLVRYRYDRDEILGQISELETERLPASLRRSE